MYRITSRYIYWFVACLSATALVSCGGAPGQDAFAECRYGAPEPIFQANLPAVARHHFQLLKGQGIERLAFKDGLELEVLQSGCEYIEQEFRFRKEGQFQKAPADFWIDEAARIFNRLGNLGPEYLSYYSLSQAIDEQAGRINLAQDIELQPGFFLKIEPVSVGDETTLVVRLSERP
jgi:hypothetical protein